MLKLKRALCAVMTAVLVLGTLLASGCSTPKYAVTLDGQQYETGEYLAYLYLAYSQVMQQAQYYLYMQSMQGTSTVNDVWDLEMPYGEEENAPSLKLEAYIKQLAKDMMIRQRALENKLTEYGISPSQEDIDEVNTQLNQYSADDLLKLGISKEHFAAAYRAVQLNDNALFYGLYDGETNPNAPFMMPEEEIRQYFTDNYLSYKVIEIALTDDDGKELSDEEKQKVYDRLDGYLAIYNETGDFDKAIEKYNEDEEAADEEEDSEGGDDTTTTTTTEAPTTTTTTAAEGGEDTGDGSDSGDEEEAEDPNRHDIDAKTYTDEDFVKAVQSVNVNEAKRVEYKKNATRLTAALILRLDPEEGEGREDFYKENRESIISKEKSDAYDELMDPVIEELGKTWTPDDSAIKMCSPKNFEKDAA